MTHGLYDRHLKTELEDALVSARFVNLVGPRQKGKATLVRDMLGTGQFVTFDDESGETGRDVRHPKSHIIDTGIAAALRGLTASDFGLGKDQTPLGSLFETYVCTELLKTLPLQHDEWRLFHWRDRGGKEVDIVEDHNVCGMDRRRLNPSSGFKSNRLVFTAPGTLWHLHIIPQNCRNGCRRAGAGLGFRLRARQGEEMGIP